MMALALRKSLQLLIILVGIVCLVSCNAFAAKRVALVIGNSNYQNTSSLNNPVNDANLMATSLEKAGFEVTKILDADYRTLKRSLLEFGRRLYNKPEAGLFYYAGHGVQVRGENYLIPVNAKIDKEDEIDFEAIPVNDFLRVMNSSTSSINIVVLDACRNNPFARSFRSASRGLAPVDAPKGTYIAYATAPGDVAADGKGKNSPYTTALSKAITKRGITIEKAFKTARQSVLKVTHNQQVPWETSSITGDFYFLKQEKVIVKQKPEQELISNTSSDEARKVYNDIKDSGDITTLEIFAKQYPNSIYAKFARGKIDALKGKTQKKITVTSLDTTTREFRSSDSLLNECDRLSAVKNDLNNKTGYDSEFSNLEKNSKIAISACEVANAKYPADRQTLFQLGRSYFSAKQYVKAVNKFQLAQNGGYTHATISLAFLYENGLGVNQDYKEAAKLYKIAAKKENLLATTMLAFLYYEGQGVGQDYKEAARLLKFASDKGDANAAYGLGLMYTEGKGVLKDYNQAAQLFKFASDNGVAGAKHQLELLPSKK